MYMMSQKSVSCVNWNYSRNTHSEENSSYIFRILMNEVTCSSYFHLNKTVVLIMGGGGGEGGAKKGLIVFANFYKIFRVIRPFLLCKIFLCWIN